MKKIFCPKCDGEIILSDKKISELRALDQERASVVCNHCAHQIRIRIKPSNQSSKQEGNSPEQTGEELGHIVVLENVFGYKQYFPLRFGLNRIGRRNKDTEVDIPVITGDPSMDRHHAIIKISRTKAGKLLYSLADDDSRVGTFVADSLLAPKEWRYLNSGDIFTLGATTIIFSTEPLPIEHSEVDSEAL